MKAANALALLRLPRRRLVGWRLGLLVLLAPGCTSSDARLPWVASALGDVVFSSECTAVRAIPEEQQVRFATRAAAEQLGYRAASAAECGETNAAAARKDVSGAAAPDLPNGGGRSVALEEPGTRATNAPDSGSATTPTQRAPREPELGAELPQPRGRRCPVERIIDGDTLVCEGGERVRLLLIDTPERAQQPFSDLATEALSSLLGEHAVIWLETDVQPVDRYGRTLAYLWLQDGRMVNEEMALSGYAVSLTYPPNVRYVERIRAAVAEAQAAERGLWSTPAFTCTPRDHRARRC